MAKFRPKILAVDLTTGKAEAIELPTGWAQDFIGGRGLGTRMLWERQPQGLDPLAPEAEIYILTGPLTGIAPGGSQSCLVFKSPLTEQTIGYSLTGGQWGTELRCAGYDGLVIRGVAEKPAWLLITDNGAEFRDAGNLWGCTTWETQVILKEEIKDPGARILCIGPAGEKQVRFASVQQEFFRAAARCGSGCVWGAKRLKAIVVRGTRPLAAVNPEDTFHVRREIEERLIASRQNHRRAYELVRWGSTVSLRAHAEKARLAVRNYREGAWEEIAQIDGLKYELRFRSRARSCFSCPLGCMQVGVIRGGPFDGKIVCPDFDSTATIGPGCQVNDLGAMVYLSRWADEQGLDATSLGNITGFVMECYEKGLLTLSDLEGIDLRWGNVSAILALWKKIVSREGIGALLAEGVKRAAAAIGKGAERFAMQVKGVEFPGFTPQGDPERALQYAVADRGPCHHYGGTIAEQNHRVWADSLTVCSWHRRLVPPEMYLQLLRAVTGWEVDINEWDIIAERMLLLARVYNLREGMIPLRDDVLPERVHQEPLTRGEKAGTVYPRARFLADRLAWYQRRGCDASGIPTPEHLDTLGLGFTIPVINDIFTDGV
ncbi:Aldehyde ferredoxin oxidoreductase, C-terminal [Moorella glycerini]|uniref:Oxidoreductase YdhV n=1 Tax=Neomoorella stamsii TaxID=1266720 RepID=A0A9X7J508_9FIRM|nr:MULTISPECIES: aldehyde ferredoxin oxidoreductase family protein [Moorella]PRR73572.1 putative oxidoreductase YdhV [Moorella stamsii]CEP69341.1 Aldehyde ferredoxin oxidoreductase, C-terminal [Moorella glycerini]